MGATTARKGALSPTRTETGAASTSLSLVASSESPPMCNLVAQGHSWADAQRQPGELCVPGTIASRTSQRRMSSAQDARTGRPASLSKSAIPCETGTGNRLARNPFRMALRQSCAVSVNAEMRTRLTWQELK